MLKFLLPLFSAAVVTPVSAITLEYSTSGGVCEVISWSGEAPADGILSIPETYTDEAGKTYKVTSIAPHALDHLHGVVVIEIPASVESIGNAEKDMWSFSIDNFDDCPQLEKFVVDSENAMYATERSGALISKNGIKYYKMPQAMKCNDGSYTMSHDVQYLSPNALAGNTTVKDMMISRMLQNFSYTNGFTEMEAIEYFSAGGNQQYETRDGILYSKSYDSSATKRLVAYPAAKPSITVSLYSGAAVIGMRAFANNKYLQEVKIPRGVKEIYGGAFSHARSLRTVTISDGIESLSDSIFISCHELTTIKCETEISIPSKFAYDCPKLTTVDTDGFAPSNVHSKAFTHCKSLVDFTFGASTYFGADSVFADCGFTDVVYNSDYAGPNPFTGVYQFAGCRNLKKIDMSAAQMGATPYAIVPGVGADCPMLETVIFPSLTSFGANAAIGPCFGYDSKITKVVTGSFDIEPGGVVIGYSGPGVRTPELYAAVKGVSGTEQIPFSQFFSLQGGAEVSPVIYCDLYSPSETDKANNRYVIKNATYFIPGSCAANYAEAAEAGCDLKPMFDLTVNKTEGKTTVICSPEMQGVTIAGVGVNDDKPVMESGDGEFEIDIPYAEVSTVEVYYTVNGVDMTTRYPAVDKITSGVTVIGTDTVGADAEYYDLHGRKVANPFGGLYIVRRGAIVTKEFIK